MTTHFSIKRFKLLFKTNGRKQKQIQQQQKKSKQKTPPPKKYDSFFMQAFDCQKFAVETFFSSASHEFLILPEKNSSALPC